MTKLTYQNYILLPRAGVRFSDYKPTLEAGEAFDKLAVNTHLDDVLNLQFPSGAIVLDSTGHRGAKLIRVPETELPNLRSQLPGLRIVPEVFYYSQRWQQEVHRTPALQANQARVGVRIQLKEAEVGKPIAGATVVAFTNFDRREGEQTLSDVQGVVWFKSLASRPLEQLYVYPKVGYWSLWRQKLTLKNGDIFSLRPLKLGVQDAKNYFYPPAPDGTPAGQGVKVGVIDTGAGPHPDLTITGGGCTVTGDDSTDFSDVDEHGSHVAGIIAAHGTTPTGVRGVAPGVDLYVYRVFSRERRGASNFFIIKAIEQAVADGCDLINMSLSGGPADDALEDAISFAYDKGTVCFVATGNDGRQPVSFPASFSLSLAVSAMGRKGLFPTGTTDTPTVAAPFGSDKKNFVAAFSNQGPEVDFIAPGVGIISTVPGGYAPLSGTSMACPMATGVAARLLSVESSILALPRTAVRAEAIVRLLSTHVRPMGFGPTFEGTGMLFV